MSQEELASQDNAVKLAEIFDVGLDCLIFGKEETKNPVDKSELLYKLHTGMYGRQHSKITNFYEFVARFLSLLLYFIYGLIKLL